jgi:hypothetical protein
MNNKIIKDLVKESYLNNNLDEKKVTKIASMLDRSDLRKYINALKLAEKEKTVLVLSPIINQDLKTIKDIFPNKKIVIKKDTTLLLGVKIINNDIVYEFTLKNTFDKIVNYIGQNYV